MPTPPLPFDLEPRGPFAVAAYPAGATFGPRRLRDWEFVWMIEGDAEYRRDDAVADAPAGSVVLCRPNATDFFRWDPRRRTRHGYFHFDLRGDLPPDWPPADDWPLVRVPADGDADLLRPLFRALLATPAGTGDPTQTRLLALSLLAAFATGRDAGGGGVDRPEHPEPVARGLAFIALRLDESPEAGIPLAEIARAACVTPEHLIRLFKRATGRTPAETVRLARLERAAVLLARTNYGVAEVARLCGFESPFHFSRLFRRAYGQSPTEMRRAVAAGGAVPTSPRVVRGG
jgi:AraC-like DNA-binding protein